MKGLGRGVAMNIGIYLFKTSIMLSKGPTVRTNFLLSLTFKAPHRASSLFTTTYPSSSQNEQFPQFP